jgi:hypothetical protein
VTLRFTGGGAAGAWALVVIALASACGDADEATRHQRAPRGVACQEGGPCACGSEREGTTKCLNGTATCECPTCNRMWPESGPRCFEPCGGDPIGAWTLDRTCASAGKWTGDCDSAVTPRDLGSQLEITFTRETFKVTGTERWHYDFFSMDSNDTRGSLTCLNADYCAGGEGEMTLYRGGTSFGMENAHGKCAAAACGSCLCAVVAIHDITESESEWTYRRSGNVLGATSANNPEEARALDYCVQGDELWIHSYLGYANGETAYIFRRTAADDGTVSR